MPGTGPDQWGGDSWLDLELRLDLLIVIKRFDPILGVHDSWIAILSVDSYYFN